MCRARDADVIVGRKNAIAPYMSHTVVSSMRAPDDPQMLRQLVDELANFEDIAKSLLPQPGDLPRLRGIDVCGKTLALNGMSKRRVVESSEGSFQYGYIIEGGMSPSKTSSSRTRCPLPTPPIDGLHDI